MASDAWREIRSRSSSVLCHDKCIVKIHWYSFQVSGDYAVNVIVKMLKEKAFSPTGDRTKRNGVGLSKSGGDLWRT